MKLIFATTALAATLSFVPAFAQEVAPAASPPPAADGAVSVEGVKPSKVLGAIDTKKLVTPDRGPSAQAGPPLSIPEKTTSVTTIETPAETAKPMVNIAAVDVPLPPEVASVASKSRYSTKDLVQAQLMAMNNAPPIEKTVTNTTTITYPNEINAPQAPASAGQGDQPRTADGTSGHSGDLPAPQPSSGAVSPG